jgi:hypothetical protein
MKKKIIGVLFVAILLGFLSQPVLAETTNNSSLQELIQLLQEQIEELRARIAAIMEQVESLRQARLEVKEEVKEIKVTLRLIRQLRIGMTGEDVELLQEILATDPEVYPEGLVTGYFGPLTEKAVKRFQKIAGIEQVGIVGPKTLSRINELLEEGAGASGKVPPGLLIAPGIRKKLGFEPQPLPGQKLPPGIAKKLDEGIPGEEDTTPPIISEVTATDITTTTARITWLTDEESNSIVWYGTTTPLVVDESTPMASSSDLVLNHDIALSNLIPNTTYYFIVNSTDESDNNEISEEETFTTLQEAIDKEQACIDSGGQVATSSCCLSTGDFPNLCLVGACGCSPENSHEVKICDCGTGKCFNGSECVTE